MSGLWPLLGRAAVYDTIMAVPPPLGSPPTPCRHGRPISLGVSTHPLQVFSFLNELYARFDAVVELFNVYKVSGPGSVVYKVRMSRPELCVGHAAMTV